MGRMIRAGYNRSAGAAVSGRAALPVRPTAGLVVGAFVVMAVGGEGWPGAGLWAQERALLPRLTEIRQVRDLSPDEAARGYRVEVDAVITFVNAPRGVLFVEDATAGVFVDAPVPGELQRGLGVHVVGRTAAGNFNPIVRAEQILPGGGTTLSIPTRATLAAVNSGALDCEWVEVEGVVRATPTVSGVRGIKLAVDDGVLSCWIKDDTAWPWDELVGASVRVRGVCAGALGERSELYGFDVFSTDVTDLTLVRPAPFGEADVSNRNINGLLLDLRKGGAGRARTRGRVTVHWPGRFLFIQDATGAVELRANQMEEQLQPGDEVEAMGFPSLRNRRVVLEDCRVRKLADGSRPGAPRKTALEIFSESGQGHLVTVEARLLDASMHPRIRASGLAPTMVEGVPLLLLSWSNVVFRAELPPEVSREELEQFKPGSQLALTGVCVSDPSEADLVKTYRMIVDGPAGIAVIKNAPWWTPRRFFFFVGGTALTALSIMGWVVGFTQRRRRQAERAMRRRNADIIRLQKVLLELAGTPEDASGDLVQRVTEKVAAALEVQRVSVWEYHEEPGRLRCLDLYLRGTHQHTRAPDLTAAHFPGYFAALKEARGIAVDDARTDPRTSEFAEGYLKPLDIHSMLDVPVRWRGSIAAVLCLEHTGARRNWTMEEHSFAAGVADRLSVHLEERERLRAEAALRKSEEKFARAFGSSPDAIVITRLRDGMVIEANEGCSRIYGYTKDELIGIKSSETVWTTGDREHFVGLIERQGHVRELKAWQRRKNGEAFPAQISSETIEIDGERCLVSVVRDLTERKRAEADRQRLLAQLMSAEDEERGRIARELHDTTAQHLAVVTINLTQMLGDRVSLAPRVTKLVEESLQLAGQAVQEIRTLTYLLHPPLLEQLGLAGALRDYAAGFVKRCGLQVTVDVEEFSGRLRREAELALFRVVQESLVNVHRHSGSATAMVRLARDEDEVRLEIQDSGCGLPVAAPDRVVGVGIAGMRERLRQLGGELEIESDAQGVTVLASLPVATNDRGSEDDDQSRVGDRATRPISA